MFYVDHILDFVNKQKQPLEIVLQINRHPEYVNAKPFFASSPTKMFFQENVSKYAANLKLSNHAEERF